MRQRRALLPVLWLLLFALCRAAAAGDACVARFGPNATSGDTFELRLEDGFDPVVARAALAMWGVCTAYGAGFPDFSLEAGPSRVVSVRLLPASGKAVCGELRGREIVLYAFARLPNGRIQRCEPVSETLAHELGHVLGLLDAPHGGTCADHIMAALPVTRSRRAVTEAECGAVDLRWRTALEVWPREVRGVMASASW